MEEKKFDPYQFTGFILIALILTWMLYRNGPEQQIQENQTKIEQVEASPTGQIINDSLQQQQITLLLPLGTLSLRMCNEPHPLKSFGIHPT